MPRLSASSRASGAIRTCGRIREQKWSRNGSEIEQKTRVEVEQNESRMKATERRFRCISYLSVRFGDDQKSTDDHHDKQSVRKGQTKQRISRVPGSL